MMTMIALFAGLSAPAFASCDTRKEDEQAVCASKCEDAYLKDTMSFSADLDKIKSTKKACDAACGCPQNTKS
jgi:hypothetical protein